MTMTTQNSRPNAQGPRAEDRRADRSTFMWIAGVFAAYLVVEVMSKITEYERSANSVSPAHFTIYEVSSVVVALALLPLISKVVSLATPGQHPWRHVALVHAGAVVSFSLLHVAGMVAIRKAVFFAFYGSTYIFSDNVPRDLIYEFRKDVLTYGLFVLFIAFGRQLDQQRRELAAARDDAKKSSRLTLKSGGRTIWLAAEDIVWIKSASNYVEVAANGKTHLARSTLTAMERQLSDTGAPAIRVHRSHIVNADHIRQIDPTGEGDVKIKMSDGAVVPGSRRYRDRLPSAASSKIVS